MIGSHVRDFRCCACGYCCYRNKEWDSYLFFDETTYEKIASEGIDDIKNNIVVSQNHIRKLKCTGNQCSFLNKNNLCDINLKYGYKYLPDACKTYPRIIGVSTRGIEASLVFMCREAIRTIIAQGKITFSEEEISGLILPNTFHYELSSTDEYDIYRIKEYFAFLPKAINCLQNRDLSLRERLLILGEESLRMSEYTGSDDFLESSTTDALGMLHEIIISRTYEADNDYTEPYIANVKKIGSIICDNAIFLSEFQRCNEKFIAREYGNYEYILENYLVNFMTTNIYFFNGSAFGYTMMVMLLSAIKLFMSGYAAFYQRCLDEEIIITAIQTVDTAFFGHINWFSNKITDSIKQHGMHEATKMAMALGQAL